MSGVNFIFDGSSEGIKAAAAEATAALKKAETQGEATTEATKALAAANEQAAEALDTATKAAKSNADATKKAGKESEKAMLSASEKAFLFGKTIGETKKKVENDFGKVEQAADKLSGGMAGDMKLAGEAMAALMSPAGIAVAAVVGVGVALAAGASAIYGFVTGADEALDRLEDLQEFGSMDALTPVTPDQVEQIRHANDALDALWVVADALVITVGADLAPAFGDAAVYALDLALAANDVVVGWTDANDLLVELAAWLGSSFVQALLAPVSAVMTLLKVVAEATRFINGDAADAIRKVADNYDEWTDGIARSTLGLDEHTEAEKDATTRSEKLIEQVRASKLAREQQAENEKKAAEAIKATEEATRKAEEAERKRTATMGEQDAAWRKILDLQKEAASDALTASERVTESYRKRIAAINEATNTALDAAVALGQSEEEQVAIVEEAELAKAEARRRAARERAGLDYAAAEAAMATTASVAAFEDAVAKERADKAKAEAEKLQEIRAEEANAWITLATQTADAIASIMGSMSDREAQRIEASLEANAAAQEEQRRILEEGGDALTEQDRKNAETRLAILEHNGALMAGEQQAFMERQHKIEKAAAVSSIIIDTAVAAIKAVAELGPVAGGVAAAGIVIAGAAATAEVLSAPAPTFHDGGMIEAQFPGARPRAQLASDEVPITAKAGEFMVNSRAAAKNRPALEEMNRTGRASGGGVTVVIGGQAISDYLVRDANSDSAFGRLFIDPLPSARMAYR